MDGTSLVPIRNTMDEAWKHVASVAPSEATQEEYDRLHGLRRALLPIEAEAEKELTEKINTVAKELNHQMFEESEISFEPLTWRWANGLPKIAPMRIEEPTFTLTAGLANRKRGDATAGIGSDFRYPKEIIECYDDLFESMKRQCFRSESYLRYSFTFRGLIPDVTRIAIADAIKSHKFDGIYILAESPADEWEIAHDPGKSWFTEGADHVAQTRTQIRSALAAIAADPIVAGYAHGALWVIDRFDTTPLEEYLLGEFSHRQLEAGE